jgi:Holliday junction resolvase RusA-like endonuclease
MPPTVNKLYFTMRGARVLSAEGRRAKTQIQAQVTAAAAANKSLEKERPLTLKIDLFFARLENKGWCKGKAKSRYKRIDTTNRAKLIEDAIAKALGIDDSLFFKVVLTKHVSDSNEYASIIIEEYDE